MSTEKKGARGEEIERKNRITKMREKEKDKKKSPLTG